MPDARDILYVAITRPAMKMGVPVEGLAFNAALTFLAYAWSAGNLWRMLASLLIFPALHFPMRLVASLDHHLFRIYRLWLENGVSLKQRQWGGVLLAALPTRRPRNERGIAGSV
jgi:type IV secretory pathway VirB3-like protein